MDACLKPSSSTFERNNQRKLLNGTQKKIMLNRAEYERVQKSLSCKNADNHEVYLRNQGAVIKGSETSLLHTC